jgi:cytochrome oxidase Cu insertion factor (SCO1/SenC/PrrC family)
VKLAGWATAVVCAAGAVATPAAGQGTPQKEQGPAVGQRAPDFSLTAATRQGVQQRPVALHDFKGKTVVLAFFYKARTKG